MSLSIKTSFRKRTPFSCSIRHSFYVRKNCAVMEITNDELKYICSSRSSQLCLFFFSLFNMPVHSTQRQDPVSRFIHKIFPRILCWNSPDSAKCMFDMYRIEGFLILSISVYQGLRLSHFPCIVSNLEIFDLGSESKQPNKKQNTGLFFLLPM